MAKSPVKKRNPQDATRRNVQASAKRDAILDERIDQLGRRLKRIEDAIVDLAEAGLAPSHAEAIKAAMQQS